MTSPLWTPTRERALATNMATFARVTGSSPLDYSSLYDWSIRQPADFWAALWRYGEVVGEQGDEVLRLEANLAACRFFPRATLNYAENLLARLPEDRPALVTYDESARVSTLSAEALRADVAAFASVLRSSGIERSDHVVAMLPNAAQVLVAMLAAASIGAVFSSASPDFGATAVLDRFGQIEPTAFIGCTEYTYAGKLIDCSQKVTEIAEALQSLRLRITVGERRLVGFGDWHELLAAHAGAPLTFEPLPFDHPLYVLYSSGTTGKPKCIVHRAGGVLLMHVREQRLHADIRAGDVVTYYTTTGWMMWN